MNINERTEHTEQFLDQLMETLKRKSEDYSHDGRAFQDFETVAHIVGITREQVALAFLSKHLIALARWARSGEMSCDSVAERAGDVAGYASIIGAMGAADDNHFTSAARKQVAEWNDCYSPPADTDRTDSFAEVSLDKITARSAALVPGAQVYVTVRDINVVGHIWKVVRYYKPDGNLGASWWYRVIIGDASMVIECRFHYLKPVCPGAEDAADVGSVGVGKA